jgi:hypothetical protein
MIIAIPPAIAPQIKRDFRALSFVDDKGMFGRLVGWAVGTKIGEGPPVGLAVKSREGDSLLVGLAVESREGDGRGVIMADGAKEGDFEATDVGPKEGVWVEVIEGAPVGMKDGNTDGAPEGSRLGVVDGTVDKLGLNVGAASGEDNPPSRTSTSITDESSAASRSKERNLTRPPVPILKPVSTMFTISAVERGAAAAVVVT